VLLYWRWIITKLKTLVCKAHIVLTIVPREGWILHRQSTPTTLSVLASVTLVQGGRVRQNGFNVLGFFQLHLEIQKNRDIADDWIEIFVGFNNRHSKWKVHNHGSTGILEILQGRGRAGRATIATRDDVALRRDPEGKSESDKSRERNVHDASRTSALKCKVRYTVGGMREQYQVRTVEFGKGNAYKITYICFSKCQRFFL
jgi:hypothetical protein